MRIKKTIAAILTSVMMLSLAGCSGGAYKKNADILVSVVKDHGGVEVNYDDATNREMAAKGFVIETDNSDQIARTLSGFSTVIDSDDVKTLTAYTQMSDELIALCLVCETESESVAKDAVDAAGVMLNTNTSFSGNVNINKTVTLAMEEAGSGIYYMFTSDEDCFVIYSVIGSGDKLNDAIDTMEDFCDLTGFDNPAK